MSLSSGNGQRLVHRRPVIVLDGCESIEGRALLTISALYWCAQWLPRVDVRFSDVMDEDVILAVNALRWDCGASVALVRASSVRSPLLGADLYGGIAFRSVSHLRLAEAAAIGIPAVVAVQFPFEDEFRPNLLLRQLAAFDPRVFADELYAIVKPWI
jgi:hypothetical protein